jgi:glycosyltransferase involved in cell wall biosynthesis
MLQDDRVAGGIGYGYAHMTGINAAEGDIVVCADADGTYPIEDTPRILDLMNRENLRFVSGTRYPTKDIPLKLKFGVQALNIEIMLLYGVLIRDSLSGMWIFQKNAIPELKLTEGDWNLSPQIKLNAKQYLGKQAAEVKIVQKTRHGETKQNYFKTGIRHFCWIAKNRFIKREGIQPHDV